MNKKIQFTSLDAAETIFFLRQLEVIESETYNVEYPEYTYSRDFPIGNQGGPGAKTITYRQYDKVGSMQIIASYADDLPRTNVFANEFSVNIKSIGGSVEYSVQDIRYAQFSGQSIEALEMQAAREVYEQTVNKYAYLADGTAAYGGLYGLFYNANITKNAAPTGNWANATPMQIIDDVSYLINRPKILTKGIEFVDTVRFGITQFAKMATTKVSDDSDTTILEFCKKVHPGVDFGELAYCENLTKVPSTGADGNVNIAVAYRRNRRKLELIIPQMWETFPPQERNLAFIVPNHARLAGLVVRYPLSVHLVEGL